MEKFLFLSIRYSLFFLVLCFVSCNTQKFEGVENYTFSEKDYSIEITKSLVSNAKGVSSGPNFIKLSSYSLSEIFYYLYPNIELRAKFPSTKFDLKIESNLNPMDIGNFKNNFLIDFSDKFNLILDSSFVASQKIIINSATNKFIENQNKESIESKGTIYQNKNGALSMYNQQLSKSIDILTSQSKYKVEYTGFDSSQYDFINLPIDKGISNLSSYLDSIGVNNIVKDYRLKKYIIKSKQAEKPNHILLFL